MEVGGHIAINREDAMAKLDASVLSYDGKDFVRTETTLMEGGHSAVNTKLDHDSAAYKALVQKRSYTGPAKVFGRDYQANYAPLLGADGAEVALRRSSFHFNGGNP